ncbi:MAG: hypothetical protein Q4G64_06765, partial [bacterium]|nr:hypothetical protein [bacterium]
ASWVSRDVVVPADPSAAAFWLVAGAVHPAASITLPHVGLNPTRLGVIRVLERMGATITVTPASVDGPEPAGDLTVTSAGRLTAVDLGPQEVADVIDELPVLAIAMASAQGTSTVRGAGELRVKESDRIRLVVDGLAAIGVDVTETEDGWTITGAPVRPNIGEGAPESEAPPSAIRTNGEGAPESEVPPSAIRTGGEEGPAVIRTDGDHRIAMAFAVADLVGVGTRGATPDDPECAAVSYPTFWNDLEGLR